MEDVVMPVMSLLRRAYARLFPPLDTFQRCLRNWILPDCQRVLDVGCGDQGVLPRRVPGIPFCLGIDAKVPNAESARLHSDYIEMDIRDIENHFEPGSFDCVVALDVIEHLERPDGLALLRAMERIASKRVVIFTPNGFLPQPAAPDNPFQMHVSGWDVNDMEERGYTVVGVNGFRPLRGPYAEIRWRPTRFWLRASQLSQHVVETRPRFAFQLLCFKDVANGGRGEASE